MPANKRLQVILEQLRKGTITVEDAKREIDFLRIEAVGEIANLDVGRFLRCGVPEVVFAEGKEAGQLADIALALAGTSGRCLVSRISRAQYTFLADRATAAGLEIICHEPARMAVLSRGVPVEPSGGVVGIITAGTSDIRVAEEARVVACEMGCRVCTAYDVGAAGIHRLFPAIRKCFDAHVFVVAAGREGTLPAVVAGLVDRPVIGVPVSTGYGYMGQGQAALASMLQSCSVLAVVNIDAGFTAGAFAAQIANMAVVQ
ncbi:MAG TPA: nickel pincer cofactor biosynthesis protein LarB [Methanoregulaceae archaeon]|nr:MAG: nickel pincer cofactor biosynthesis protein LarB [Methanolinea sp.]HON81156.1 nickel pincer cofactor biosynthesis protein LarB [Methanoregulaceae archaeon]HPD09900.1 nickel pincer cofactor biosynthesis protein LarB [Methanoregulaceae archaeon]HRT14909.1 nickel pincer cofactor biosynthesis protein LarB [Methanoregulaceae archaeon]HRU30476.1 nickel pincer cofactor biosynthesis protein LarB [Methanoregulaceae archaeon]